MTSQKPDLPDATDAHLVERLEQFPPGLRFRRWVLRDDNHQHRHGVIPLSDKVAHMELLWTRSTEAPVQVVGRYRLYLGALLDQGFIREDSTTGVSDGLRVRFCRGDGEVIAIQRRADAPALPVGRVSLDLASRAANACACDCGGTPAAGDFLPGHDQRLRSVLEREVGGLLRLKSLVTSASGFTSEAQSAEAFLETVRALFGSSRNGPAQRSGLEPAVNVVESQSLAHDISGIHGAANSLQGFAGDQLTERIAHLESQFQGATLKTIHGLLDSASITKQLLSAAHLLKKVAGQVNVVIHALGILLTLPRILGENEKVLYLSLGAGNAGRPFDLETNARVAEFKFINWQGGPETIRQNALFKDFYLLAEHSTPKQKFLYVIGTAHPLRFLEGGRALSSVMSRHRQLWDEFTARHSSRYRTVGDYYTERRDVVTLVDLEPLLGDVGDVFAGGDEAELGRESTA